MDGRVDVEPLIARTAERASVPVRFFVLGLFWLLTANQTIMCVTSHALPSACAGANH